MKTKFTMVLATTIAIALFGLQKANAQANTSLSNLTSPTAVSQHLSPNYNNIKNLGSASKSWRSLFIDSVLFLKDTIFLHNTGLYNTFVGSQAGKSVTSGVQNVAFGWNSLYANTSGSQNTALGKAVLLKNIDGSFNTGSGYQALYNNDHGINNTATGAYSLFINQGGSNNTAVGFSALRVNSTGGFNTATGYNSLYANQSGGYNTAMGGSSLLSNTIGGYNTACGYQSLNTNTIGSWNTATGLNALYSNQDGNYNTATGLNALFSNTNGSQNTTVGYQAGYYNTTGTNNVYLGYNANGAAGLINTVAIGANVFATLNNTIILGTSQNVGIGTTAPQYRLSVNGTIQAKELRVETGWSDYVFEKNYSLRSLASVAVYINKYKHLPGINSAKDIQQNGLAVADMQTKMMAKIEELTLYLIEQQKSISHLKEQNIRLEVSIHSLAKKGGK